MPQGDWGTLSSHSLLDKPLGYPDISIFASVFIFLILIVVVILILILMRVDLLHLDTMVLWLDELKGKQSSNNN